MLEISVIICAHNPRPHYLARVLNALRAQSLPLQQWELLLVDNASRLPLANVWDLSWHPNASYHFEQTLGLAHARQRGMYEAAAGVLVFVDDDNLLDPDYLSRVIRIKNEWPRLGVWGSAATKPEFELNPSDALKEYISYLALRDTKAVCWSNVFTCREAMPWGAGMCIRRNVATAYRQYWQETTIHIPDRSGNALVSGGDVEISHVACGLGLGMGIFPELKVTHLIPKERVTEDYLVRLREGIALSDNLLAYKWQAKVPRNYLSVFGVIRILKNVLVYRGIRRRMYLAEVRASINARQFIMASEIKG